MTERQKLYRLSRENPSINSALGLANTELDDDHILTEKINARETSKLMNIDYDLCCHFVPGIRCGTR